MNKINSSSPMFTTDDDNGKRHEDQDPVRRTVVFSSLGNDNEIASLADLFLSSDDGLAFALREDEVLR